MPAKRYIVNLSDEERGMLKELIYSGTTKARINTRARVLLLADEHPKWSDGKIAESLHVSVPTIERIRRRCVMEDLDSALYDRKSSRIFERKLDGKGEAMLVALACSKAPEGSTHWSLNMLADKLVELEVVDTISHECVRQTLKKMNLNHGIKRVG